MVRVSLPVLVKLLLVFQAVVVRSVWIPPRKPLHENTDYNSPVAKIHSDFDDGSGNIIYSLEGKGASEPPYHVFIVDEKTGFITLTKRLDREVIDTYNLEGVAKYANGKLAEDNVAIKFKVVDENDCPPVFGAIEPGEVNEHSLPGTAIMKLNVTDADEEGLPNSMIAYSIVSQDPPGDMFYIAKDGTLRLKSTGLDREIADKFTVTVKAQDLDGAPGGNSAVATITVNVKDVNDNLPTLEKEAYEGNIEENTQGVEVMRIKAEDLDVDPDNKDPVYEIVKGNEAGYFSFKTDPVTKEGILMLDKAVDYEDVKDLDLGIVVRNRNPPFDGSSGSSGATIGLGGGSGGGSGGGGGGGGGGSGGGGGGSGGGGGGGTGGGGGGTSGSSWTTGTSWYSNFKTYPLKINVKNKPEGPAFDPKVKSIPISEGGKTFKINDIIATYPAIDGDTKEPAKNVRYVKGSDPDNWLTIDPETAEIRLNKIPDRESPYLVNGTYMAKVLCISEDEPDKTATGMVAIEVEDFNDHCPKLTSTNQIMCTSADSVIVNAKDEDLFPNGPPFDFIILPENTEGKWRVEHLNDTAAILRSHETLWPGSFKVAFEVRDEQGHACPEPQIVEVQVCTCEDGVTCGKRGANGKVSKEAVFGPAGIGLLFLGLLMLLLIPLLLLFCQCGSAAGMPGAFAEMPFDTKSNLINYRTEGQGENTEVPLLNMPSKVDGDLTRMDTIAYKSAVPDVGLNQADYMNTAGYSHGFDREMEWGGMNGSGHYSGFRYQGAASAAGGGGGGLFDGMALPDHILRQYYCQKLASGNENLAAEDSLVIRDYEGQGSPAGSVGCCSLLESDNDLQFLDDLGPKFKTLAEVCVGKKIPTEVKSAFTPPPLPAINTQSFVSSVASTQQLPPLPQPTIPKTERTVVKEIVREGVSSVREGMSTVNQGMSTVNQGMSTVNRGVSNQGQTLVLPQQQPVYYTTTPMLQPMQYVVQPPVQNTVLLAGAPANNLQGMVLVNSAQTVPAQGMIVQGQTMMSTAQAQGPGMVLVGGSGVQGGTQTMMVVEGKVPKGSLKVLNGSQTSLVQGGTLPAGSIIGSQRILGGTLPTGSVKVLHGSQTNLVQGGTLQPGGISGSQNIMVVGGTSVGGGQLVQGAGGLLQNSDFSGSQGVLYSKGSSSAGSKSNLVGSTTTTVKTTPTYSKTTVTEKFTEL